MPSVFSSSRLRRMSILSVLRHRMILSLIAKRPEKPDNTLWVALSVASALFVVLLAFLGESSLVFIYGLVAALWYVGRTGKGGDFGQIRLPESEVAKLMADHVPGSLYFIHSWEPCYPQQYIEARTGDGHYGCFWCGKIDFPGHSRSQGVCCQWYDSCQWP